MSRLTIIAAVVALAVALAGYGWGAVASARASAQARRAAAELSEAHRVIAEQKTALRAADAAAGALSRRLKAAQALAQEKQKHDAQDAKALAEAKEWADSPIPEPVRLRLLDN